MTKEQLLEIVDKINEHGNRYIRVGIDPYDTDKTFLIFDSWADLYHLHGMINGFPDLPDKPYFGPG